MKTVCMFCAVLLAGIGVSAYGAVANFDDLTEGTFIEGDLTNGGITFFDLDWRVPPDPNDSLPAVPPFSIDDATGSRLADGPGISMPNVLTAFAYTPGGLWYSRWGSLSMTTGGLVDYGSIDVHTTMGPDWLMGNVITLEALRDGVVVATDSSVQDQLGDQYHPLSVSGVEFDTMRIVGSGLFQDGCFFAVFDNVVMTPEPTTLTLLVLGAVACLGRRRQ